MQEVPIKEEKALLSRSLADFFTTKFMVISTAPFLITLAISLILLYMLSGEFFNMLNVAAAAGQNPDTTGAQDTLVQFAHTYPIMAAIFGSFIFKAVAGTVIYAVGGSLALLFSIILAVIIIGFFTPLIVKEIHKRHYQDIEQKSHGSMLEYIGFMLKQFVIFFIFFLVSLPFYFVPLVNIVAVNAPFYFLFHKLLTRDVAGEILDRDEAKIIFSSAKWRLMTTTFILYLISLMPFAGMLLQVFFVIVLTHQFFDEAARVRKAQIIS